MRDREDTILGKTDTHPNKGKQEGVQWETGEIRSSGRQTHHPRKGNKKGYNGRQGRYDPREDRHTIQQRETRRGTVLDREDKILGKTDTPSNKGKQEGVQWETREIRSSGRRTHPPTKGNKKGHNGRQGR